MALSAILLVLALLPLGTTNRLAVTLPGLQLHKVKLVIAVLPELAYTLAAVVVSVAVAMVIVILKILNCK